jgi:hypothetical protein
MMHMVGDNVYFFRDHVDRQVLCEQPPEMVLETEGAMGAIPVVPYGSMGTHYNHAVDERRDEHPDTEEFEKEEEKEWHQADNLQPAEEWKPVFSVFKHV